MSIEKKIPEEEKADNSPQSTEENSKSHDQSSTKEEVIQPVINPEPEVLNKNSEIKNMEVHHPHHVMHKKKWEEYLLEFFMLFLAVFLGFVAENQREHLIENNREKQFIRSIAEDLKQDILQLDTIIRRRTLKNQMMDSLLYLINYTDLKQHGNEIYYYARWMPRTYRFYTNDRTVMQLNSGSWRLIRNKKASDALLSYKNTVRSLAVYTEQREESLVLLMYPSIYKLFDNRVFQKMLNGMSFDRPVGNPQLLSTDKNALNEYCNQIHFVQNANFYFMNTSTALINNARKTLDILKNEYKL